MNRLSISGILLVLGLTGCGGGSGGSSVGPVVVEPPVESSGYVYRVPSVMDDGWDVASVAEHGIEAAPLEGLVEDLRQGKYQDVNSLLIVRDGKLLLDEYFGEHNAER